MENTARKRKKRILAEEIAGIVLIAVAILLGLGVYASGSGVFGNTLRRISFGVFGSTAYVLPGLLFVLGVYFLIYAEKKVPAGKAVCWGFVALGIVSILHLLYMQRIDSSTFTTFVGKSYELGVNERIGGGALGAAVTYPIHLLFGLVGAYIVNIAVVLICVLIATNLSFRAMHRDTSQRIQQIRESSKMRHERKQEEKNQRIIERNGDGRTRGGLRVYTVSDDDVQQEDLYDQDLTFIPGLPNARDYKQPYAVERLTRQAAPKPFVMEDGDEAMDDEPSREPAPFSAPGRESKVDIGKDETQQAVKETEQEIEKARAKQGKKSYRIPPLSMLPHAGVQSARSRRQAQTEINATSALLERTFDNFGISARVINVSVGPSITRYEVQPAAGVRVNRIANLQDDIALALAASGVRIEAPIPGKNAIGIEVPNKERLPVMLREVLEGKTFKGNKNKLAVAVGKDIAGKHIVIDLSRMPHLLIAGTTGSGKSVCVNSMIASILFKATPDEVKMIMIDPKVVEFTAYNDIPHLLIPVVTDVKKAAGALHWGVAEMLRRYNSFAERGAKEIRRYNDIMKMMDEEPLPFVVIFIDELADLMMAAPREVEDAICRIAQMGRAAGIHLVVATQRPSVDVITGLIKANFPSRIALTVSSATDSRTILNQAGAEKLSGYGDMLFQSPQTPKPIRIQGTLITDPEVEALTDFLKSQIEEPQYDDTIMDHIDNNINNENSSGSDSLPDKDLALLNQAADVFFDAGQGSTSLLQRKLRIGYGRAARLMDEMEEMGIIGPPDGPRPRKLLMSRTEYEQQMYGKADGAVE